MIAQWHRSLVLVAAVVMLILVGRGVAQGQITEWTLEDKELSERTTVLLERYFTLTRPDSLRLHYLQNNAGLLHYRLRGTLAGKDSVTALLLLRLGQLVIFPTENLRIALGDDIYSELLGTRRGAEGTTILFGNGFGGGEWEENDRLVISLDRLDVRLSENVGAFAAIGAPESNLDWWTDATARFGVSTPEWEFAALVPFASGGVGVGPFRRRLLEPVYGASGLARAGNVSARLRLATPVDQANDTSEAARHRFAHTAGGLVSYGFAFATEQGLFRCDVGVGLEEFTPLGVDSSNNSDGRTQRFSPVVGLLWRNYSHTLGADFGVADLSLRFAFQARLTTSLTIELRGVSNNILRQHDEFEHPFFLFLTPKLRF